MIAELLGRLLLVARPDGAGVELLLAAGLVAVLLAAAAVLCAPSAHDGPAERSATPFAVLRVRLRASDPAAAGHRRARAPGVTV